MLSSPLILTILTPEQLADRRWIPEGFEISPCALCIHRTKIWANGTLALSKDYSIPSEEDKILCSYGREHMNELSNDPNIFPENVLKRVS